MLDVPLDQKETGMRFLHVGLKVDDIHRSTQLYRSLFGIEWEPVREYVLDDAVLEGEVQPCRTLVTHGRTTNGFEIEMVQLVEGHIPDELVLGDREGVSHLAFTVDDLDAAAGDAQAGGLRKVSDYRSDYVDFAFFMSGELGGVLTQLVQFKGASRD